MIMLYLFHILLILQWFERILMTDNYWLVAYLIHCQVSFFPSKTKQTKKFNLLSYEKSILHLLSRLLFKRSIFNNSISSSAIIITNILHKSNSTLLFLFHSIGKQLLKTNYIKIIIVITLQKIYFTKNWALPNAKTRKQRLENRSITNGSAIVG